AVYREEDVGPGGTVGNVEADFVAEAGEGRVQAHLRAQQRRDNGAPSPRREEPGKRDVNNSLSDGRRPLLSSGLHAPGLGPSGRVRSTVRGCQGLAHVKRPLQCMLHTGQDSKYK
ncbi:MAG: hypothetical protein ABIN58_10115, partial [candidate division WOR-3 bacterium]